MDQGPERGGKRSLGLGQVRLHAAPPLLREIYHRVQSLQQREKEIKNHLQSITSWCSAAPQTHRRELSSV
jgi:hypothetical protein